MSARKRTGTKRTTGSTRATAAERVADASTAAAAARTSGVDFTKLGLDRLIITTDLTAGLARAMPSIFGVPLRRPDDLFVGTLFRDNLRIVRGSEPRLVRDVATRVARLIVELPPQSFGEEALLEGTGPEVTAKPTSSETFTERNNTPSGATPLRQLPSVFMRMARPSRLAFLMPPDVESVPYTFAGVLEACRTWPMSRAAAAQPPNELHPRFDNAGSAMLSMLGSPEFRQHSASVSEALVMLGGPDLDRLARNAAGRLVQSAGALVERGAPRDADVQITANFRQELDRVSARMPASRSGELRALVAATISLYASDALGTLVRERPDLDVAKVFPIWPWIIRPQPVPWFATQLEVPYRLVISPVGAARFEHETLVRVKRGRHELWHTHLTTSDARTGPDREGSIRAVWSDDHAIDKATRTQLAKDSKPFRMSLDPIDRQMLVDCMAGYDRDKLGGGSYTPKASRANRLHLSALGALLDVEGEWEPRPDTADLQQWRHLMSLGRDHYVRVVYAGHLWPFGHAASLIKVTERKFESADAAAHPDSRENRVAVLRQRFFVVVRERVRQFNGARHLSGGHAFPFTAVEMLTRVTPNLAEPSKPATSITEVTGQPIYGGAVARRMAFWPMTSVGDFPFDIRATDRDGSTSTFAMPLFFVSELANAKVGPAIRAAYRSAPSTRRRAELAGATVAFAPVDSGAKGDTRLPTQQLTFTAGDTPASQTLVNVYPLVEQGVVGIQAVQRLLGRANAVVAVKYHDTYAAQGFGPQNRGELFLELTPAWSLAFGADANSARTDTLGALASPAIMIAGLSRVMGPASDLANIIGPGGGVPKFNPAAFFNHATILGGIPLDSLLDVIEGLTGDDVPKLLAQSLPATLEFPERIESRFEWATTITKSDSLGLFVPTAGGEITKFRMKGVMSAPIADTAASTFEADAAISNFKVNLFGFIVLWFLELRFDVKRGQKPDVAVDLHPAEGVTFGGPLEFVNQLKDLIPGSGFSDPPSLSVTPSGISASYSLNVPNVQVGIFALSNLSIGAGFSLPFDSRPVLVTFNFSTRERPFSLTVSLLGGGGFFALGIGAEGVREIEAAIEFGAAVSIDLGVASGGVEIKAGVYFHWITAAGGKDGLVELTGYVRLHGELSILGLISASLTFNLQLSYLKEGTTSTVWGQATLTISIDILLFSADVSVKCRRQFAGSDSDPTFVQLVPTATAWQTYCLAYGDD